MQLSALLNNGLTDFLRLEVERLRPYPLSGFERIRPYRHSIPYHVTPL
jgi:hypothetical protein